MKTEVLCNEVNFNDILKCLFESSHRKVDTICVPAGCIKKIDQDFILHHCSLSAMIDYPLGISDTQVRLHEIFLSLNRGVRCVDLVINTHDLESGNISAIYKDFKHCSAACKSRKAQLRPILEYRASDDETLFNVSKVLLDCGSIEIIIGTGLMADDIIDNIIVSKLIEDRLNTSVISCSPILCQDHYDLYHDSKISGIRIKSYRILDNLCIID
jgi:deoxyribose-phosphate aldolase